MANPIAASLAAGIRLERISWHHAKEAETQDFQFDDWITDAEIDAQYEAWVAANLGEGR